MSEGGCASAASGDLRSGAPHTILSYPNYYYYHKQMWTKTSKKMTFSWKMRGKIYYMIGKYMNATFILSLSNNIPRLIFWSRVFLHFLCRGPSWRFGFIQCVSWSLLIHTCTGTGLGRVPDLRVRVQHSGLQQSARPHIRVSVGDEKWSNSRVPAACKQPTQSPARDA